VFLVRLTITGSAQPVSTHVGEFGGDTLEEARAKAVEWNADLADQGFRASSGSVLERWLPEEERWAQIEPPE
jgi:hypothetical protein